MTSFKLFNTIKIHQSWSRQNITEQLIEFFGRFNTQMIHQMRSQTRIMHYKANGQLLLFGIP